ncbi:MAG: 3-hydroxyacyl-ACP dehydratase FabZ [Methylophilus sp.]|jgi:3-hydroxyacyl-[acyl-carrier-protein] dehydratase|uniref:3-hydroxyacyl-ACP dehydratase FabZ n=1 Tax=unclassified Methylophilus TaxID=2630143 RepID=UPI0006F3BDE5|nr:MULTISPECIES: 3-hydroxyacyl-ACP dehydratase FabZ [unclassified Methylophilus]KQT37803.1 3-hydroxyacyl-ACP dehydratase [Methylophilus sp. Leaf414]KQT43543.1 3-hydroxyacyl-ACP dehydratase [Methylophilus sp. Leaf416]KQT59029.1 3-hydroxyacyl-ACP dehydratase [Methylophilus sp. Leaf459]HSH86310.1 3-hydroxyacyl-ACP dehydratase FabZ [Methylophilus sp.]HSI29049.1 3-hydroxyacyl-ACP dehydratase FabZ [Methylophilus sp.]
MAENAVNSMDIHEILEHLPHRYPFVLVDRVLSMELGKEIVAVKNVSVNEPFFPGHFPYHPVMPGVLIVEAMAQAAAILSFKTMNIKPTNDSVYYFAGIDNVRFKKPVSPGDQIILNVKIDRILKGIWKYNAVAKVADEVVAEASMMCILKAIEK